MRSKITEKFEVLQANKQKALIGYITSGDPDLDTSVKLVTILEESGVDIIELGIPYSDPLADGPVIQRASLRALNNGANINSIFNMVKRIRERTNIPIAFLVYYNSIFRYGINNFLINCRSCGIDGLIIPDLPLEERKELNEQMKGYAIDLIPLVAPTSEDRIKEIVKDAQGFVYCISSQGVTGMRGSFDVDLAVFMKEVRKHTDIPLAIGFGISDAEMVRELKNLSDGLIVGSAIIKKIEEGISEGDIEQRVSKFVYGLHEGVRS
ncbi:MAG: tryptophan synthase subunit alpha [Vulcanibacillus sp.]